MAERISGLSIGLDLESAGVERSLNQIKNSFREVRRSAVTNMNNIKFDTKNVDSYKKNLGQLTDAYKTQQKNVDGLKRELDKLEEAGKGNSQEAQNLRNEYNKQTDEMNRLGRAVDSATAELKELTHQQAIAESNFTKFGNSLEGISKKVGEVGRGMQDVGKKMSLAITTPILGFAAAAINTGMTFDDSMAKVAAVSGATGSDLEALRQKAKDMGETTRFSASEAADGLNYMALAGWDTEEMLGGLDGVMSLAAASGEDLGSVSDIVTDSLSAFGLEAKDSSRFADVLAQTSANANTDVAGLGAAFQYVAPVAGALGFTVEDTAKAIGLMSDNGIKGQKAGTALRTMMTNLAKPTAAMEQEMNNLGISLTDNEGNMKTFDEIMNDLRDSFDGLTEEQQASAAATLFGKESMSGALAVINTTEESFDGLGDAIANSEGAAEKMADTMEGTLGGMWREIKSGIEGFSISVYETMLPALEKMSEKILEGIQWLNDLSPRAKALGVVFAGIAAAIGPLLVIGGTLLVALSAVGGAIANVSKVFGELSGGLKVVLNGTKTFAEAFPRLSGVVRVATSVFTRLGSIAMTVIRPAFAAIRVALVALTGPVGIVIGVISALAAGFVLAYKKSETFRNFIQGIGQMFANAWESILTFKDNVVSAFQGIFAIFKGDTEGGVNILQSLGLSEETVARVTSIVGSIRSKFVEMSERIKAVLSTIGTFFSNVFNSISGWWAANGSVIIGAVTGAFQRGKELIGQVWSAVSGVFISAFQFIKSWWDSNGQAILGAVVSGFEWMKETVGLVMDLIKAAIGFAFRVIQGVFETFSGIATGIWNTLWSVIVETINTFAPILKGIWNTLWSVIRNTIEIFAPIISGIITTAINIITEVFRTFKPIVLGIWNTLWPILSTVLSNAWEKMKLIVGIGMDIIQGIIKTATAILNGDWSTAWEAIRSTVVSIKDRVVATIDQLRANAISLIQRLAGGAIQWFQNMWQNLTTKATDLKDRVTLAFEILRRMAIEKIASLVGAVGTWFINMYTRVSNTAGNIRDWVVTAFNNLRDRVVTTVSNLYNRVATFFTNIYNRVSSIVGRMRDWVVTRFNSLRDAVVNTVSNLYNRVTSFFSNIYNRVSSIVNNIRNRVTSIFNNLRDRVVSTVSNLYNRISSFFTNIYNSIRDKMSSARTTAVDFATRLKDGAIEQFQNLANGARDMMNKIGDWIDEKKTMVVNKATDMGKGIANAAIGGFNKLIGGVNDVASLLGYSGDLITPIQTYSRGTKNHKGGPAIVGDKGPGNGIGGGSSTREIVELPDKRRFLMDGNVLLPDAPRGMKVTPNRDTEKELDLLKAFNPDMMTGGSGTDKDNRNGWFSNMVDWGKNAASNVVSGAKKAFSTVKSIGSKIWDYAKNPGQLVTDMISNIDLGFDLPTEALELAQLGVKKLTSTITDYVTGLFEEADGGGDGSHILGKSILQTFGRYTGGIGFNGGRHYGIDTNHKFDPLISPINGVITKIWRDFGGGNSIQVKAGKYNWWFMHLSKIIKKVGDSIKAGDRLGTTGNSGNYVVGSGHLHTQVMEGGIGNRFAIDPLPILKGLSSHALGGFIQKGGLINAHDDEFVIPMNHPTEAMKLIALASKKLGAQSKQTRQLPNVGGSGGNSDEVVNALVEQNGILMKMLEKLTGIEEKDLSVNVNEVTKKQNRYKDDRTIMI